MTTPWSWLSRSLRLFLYNSSVYSCHLVLIFPASVRSLLFLPFIVPIFAQVYQETGKVAWYSHLFKTYPQFVVIHTIKDFSIVSEAEVDVFLELSCFFYDPANVTNLISGSSAFSKSNLTIWQFLVHLQRRGREVVRIIDPIPQARGDVNCPTFGCPSTLVTVQS